MVLTGNEEHHDTDGREIVHLSPKTSILIERNGFHDIISCFAYRLRRTCGDGPLIKQVLNVGTQHL
jgi:hypothetical protein